MKTIRFLLLFLLLGVTVWSQDVLPLVDSATLDYSKSDHVFFRDLPKDWSQYQADAFTVKVNKPTEISPTVIFSSEDPQQPGMDYFAVGIPLVTAEEMNIVWPMAELAKTRHPVGWNKIDWVEIHADWTGQKRHDPSVVLTISNLRLLKGDFNDETKGPRLTNDEFFKLLDYSQKELADVQKAFEAKDFKAAKHALAEHIRTRKTPVWSSNADERPTRGQPPVTQRHVRGEDGRYVWPAIKLSPSDWHTVELQLSDAKPLGKPQGMALISGLQMKWSTLKSMKADATLRLDDITIINKDGSKRPLGDFESKTTGWTVLQRNAGSGKWQFPTLFPVATCRRCPVDWSQAEKISFRLFATEGVKGNLTVQLISSAPETNEADSIIAHKFSLQGFRKVVHDFGPRIDWSCNPMDKGETKTVEWNAKLNRCFHFSPLINAYWQTGDDKYAHELAEQMNSWIEDNPVLLFSSGNGPYHYAWETLNTGIRMHNTWPEALFRCLDSPSFTDDIIVNIMKSTVEHVRHLQRWPSKGNWLTAESYGVYVAGLMFPEFKDAKRWRLYAIDKLHTQLSEEVYPDGVQFELALGYNTWTLNEFLGAYEAALLNGMDDEFPNDYKSLLEKMYEYLMKVSMPDGMAFAMNDANNQNVRALLVKGYQLFPHRGDFIHVALGGAKEFPKPERESFGMHWAGHYVMRSGWTKNDNVMLMDAGPWGKGHQHEDKLTLSLYSRGELMFVDGGCTMYDHSRWRAYQLLTRAHNSVLIDGMDQFNGRNNLYWPLPWKGDKPAGTNSRWFSTPHMDFVEGTYSGDYREYTDYDLQAKGFQPKIQKGLSHRRNVFFFKPDLWIILDTVTAEDELEHTMEALYHVNASASFIPPRMASIKSKKPHGCVLSMISNTTSSYGVLPYIYEAKEDPPVQGWSANVRENRPPDIPMSPIQTIVNRTKWKKQCDIVTVLTANLLTSLSIGDFVYVNSELDGKILYGGWGHIDRFFLIRNDTGHMVENESISTDGLFAFCKQHVAEPIYMVLVDGTYLECEFGYVKLSNKTSFSSYFWDYPLKHTFVISAADDVSAELKLKNVKARFDVYELDRDGNRQKRVAIKRQFVPSLKLDMKRDVEYEVVMGRGPSAYKIRQDQAKIGKQEMWSIIRPFPPCGTAPEGTEVVVQAENPSSETYGKIEVADKVGADGKAFLHWDNPRHELVYEFDVPADGAYELQIKYCIADSLAERALLVDDYILDEAFRSLVFEETGGWSSDRDDWRWQTISIDGGKTPFRFNLTKGLHKFTFIDIENSMNMDVLKLKALP